MRIAYADPPYLGQSSHYPEHPQAAVWDDPVAYGQFIQNLSVRFPDGWALSASSPSLRTLLPMCPDDIRVLAWMKPFAAFKKHVNPSYAWEPILIRGGRPRTDKMTYMRDWVAQSITLRKGLTGAKPREVCFYIFDAMNLTPSDELVDLFPGSGVVSEAWIEYQESYDTVASRINRVSSRWEMGKGTIR